MLGFSRFRYGVGYHMTIVKGPDFQENQTQSLIANKVPTSKMVGNLGAEVSYVLDEQSTKYFKGLFEELEGLWYSLLFPISVCFS